MKLKTNLKSKICFTLFAAALFNSTLSYSQDNHQINEPQEEVQNAQIDQLILENAVLLADFDKAEVFAKYNSFEIKEISFEQYLRFAQFNYVQEALLHKGHSHGDIPSKALDCNNFGFENGAFATGWSGGIATFTTPFNNSTIVSNGANALLTDPIARHTIMSTPPGNNDITAGTIVGYDDYVIDPVNGIAQIPFLPAGGGNYTVRLGNRVAGSQKEKLSYNIDVTATDTMFNYQFAVVFESVLGHTNAQSSYFTAKMTDGNGAILPTPTGIFNISASQAANIPSFLQFNNNLSYYRPWETVHFNLSNYIGQTITLEFEVSDCGLGGHAAYAYLNAGCGLSTALAASQCYDGSTSELEGPVGQSNYQWYGPNSATTLIPGATNANLTVNPPVNGDIYYLEFMETISTSILKQQVVISLDSISTSPLANIDFCEGNSTATLLGASGKTNYQWFDNNHVLINGATSQNYTLNSPIVGETFHLRYDEGNCPKWQSILVSEIPHEIGQLNITGSCPGASSGAVLVVANSPAYPLLYTLNPGGLIDFGGDFQNLTPGTYQVTVTDPNGTCVTTLDSTFVIPQNIQLLAGTGDTISICKNESFDLFSALTGATDLNGNWSGNDDSQLVNGVMPAHIMGTGGTFEYTYLVNNVDCPSDSTVVTVQVLNNCSLGLNEFMAMENIIISPNPSTALFQITFDNSNTPESYSITDITGKVVKSEKIEKDKVQLTIDLNKEAAGEYYLQFYKEDQMLGSKKLIKL